MRNRIDSDRHKQTRAVLRLVGPLVLAVGLIFTAIGLVSFFASFGSFGGPPRYFWCAFIGIPITGVGLMICKLAFLGAVANYMASEVTPVGRDVANYMADGTQDAVRTVAAAIGEGLATSGGDHTSDTLRCVQCGASNEPNANFCNDCGSPIEKFVMCAKCADQNKHDARYCDHCGTEMA